VRGARPLIRFAANTPQASRRAHRETDPPTAHGVCASGSAGTPRPAGPDADRVHPGRFCLASLIANCLASLIANDHEKYGTSIHEAGHLVVAAAFGLQVSEVSVETGVLDDGTPRGGFCNISGPAESIADRMYMVAACLAGLFAAVELNGMPMDQAVQLAERDMQVAQPHIEILADEWELTREDVTARLAFLTRDVLRLNKGVVYDLAAFLRGEKTIKGPVGIAALVREAARQGRLRQCIPCGRCERCVTCDPRQVDASTRLFRPHLDCPTRH
jgi:hypothetical protein